MDRLTIQTFAESAVYICPSYVHDDPNDDLIYDFRMMDGSPLPDFIQTKGKNITMTPTSNTHAGVYRIQVTLVSEQYTRYYREHREVFVLTVLPFEF